MMLAVSEITREVDRAFMLIGGVTVLLFLGVTGAMVWFVLRYHRGRATHTVQIEGHTWLEVTWIVIPTLIVTWMFFVGYEGFGLIRTMPDDALVVEVTGQQWYWSFDYPEQGVSVTGGGGEGEGMVVPVGEPIYCQMTAPPDDVIHSFYIPDVRVKEDVLPGKTTQMWFQVDRVGTYPIFCAEFCGQDHSKMITELHVVSQAEFEKWVRDRELRRYRPLVFEAVTDPDHPGFGPEELNIKAEGLYGAFCASCHGVAGDGSGLPGVARDFRAPQGWKQLPKVTGIYRTLTEGVEGTQMRPYPNLSPWEKVALAHYVRTFLGSQAPADSQADYDALVEDYGLDEVQPPGETIPVERAMELMVEEAGGTQ